MPDSGISKQTANADFAGDDLQALGKHIRSLRKQRSLTLEELGAASAISRAALSKIERGEMSPTYDSLCKIAHGLQLGLGTLVAAGNAAGSFDGVEVMRADEAPRFETPLYRHQLLAQRSDNKRMTAFLSQVSARELSDYADGFDRHDSEDFVFVTKGRIRIYFEGREPVEASAGDALYLCGKIPHALITLPAHEHDDEDASILWVNLVD